MAARMRHVRLLRRRVDAPTVFPSSPFVCRVTPSSWFHLFRLNKRLSSSSSSMRASPPKSLKQPTKTRQLAMYPLGHDRARYTMRRTRSATRPENTDSAPSLACVAIAKARACELGRLPQRPSRTEPTSTHVGTTLSTKSACPSPTVRGGNSGLPAKSTSPDIESVSGVSSTCALPKLYSEPPAVSATECRLPALARTTLESGQSNSTCLGRATSASPRWPSLPPIPAPQLQRPPSAVAANV